MKLTYTRTFQVEIPKQVFLDALRERLDDFWGPEDDPVDPNLPPEDRFMGILDVMYWLDKKGHLNEEIEGDGSIHDHAGGREWSIHFDWEEEGFARDSYTLKQLEEELEGEE